jgi:regulator of protease activity HflC (stomatin/prohibitin superfamily)
METFIVFIVLGLFVILTVSLSFIPSEGFGVLEQMGKIHEIYSEPGLHFVMPGFQKMYLYQRETTLSFDRLLLAPDNGMLFKVSLTISLVITDIKTYHLAVKNMSLHHDLLKQMENFVASCQWSAQSIRADLNEYLVELFTKNSYPFAVSNIDVHELDQA